jgi:hypothetical protein
VAGGDAIRANLTRGDQQRIELQVVVAECAGNRRTPSQILAHERLHHLVLEPLLLVHEVVGNPQVLRDTPCVVDIVDGATPALY